MRDGFYFFKSFRDAAQNLPDTDRLAVYDALAAYAFDDKQPEPGTLAAAMLTLMIPVLDAKARKTEACVQNGQKGSEYGKLGGRPRKENPEETPKKPQTNPQETPIESESGQGTRDYRQGITDEGLQTRDFRQGISDEGEEKESSPIGEPKKDARFVPPTVAEVRAYCEERGNSVDPELFVDHYTANGWKVSGKAPMKDWRASVRTWEKNDQGPRARSGTYTDAIKNRVSVVDSWIGG